MSMSRSPHRSSQGAMALLRKNVFGAKVTIRSRPLPAFDLSGRGLRWPAYTSSAHRKGQKPSPATGGNFSLAATA
jgi:hypothetical protein